jgi:deoxyribodipyrimidine photo-lyase
MAADLASSAPALMWFRDDLRLADNAALTAAAASGRPVVALYVLDDGSDRRPLGGASRWWLHQSLDALSRNLAERDVPLVLMRGTAEDAVPAVVAATRAVEIHWSRRIGAKERAVDAALKASLSESGVRAYSHPGHLLVEPWTVRPKSGDFFRVFTPFWRAVRERLDDLPAPLPVPRLRGGSAPNVGVALDALGLEPISPDWAGGLRETWKPGEAGARDRLSRFLDRALARYADERDVPSAAATSELSPHLRFGEVSASTVWHAVSHAAAADPRSARGAEKYLSELGWREFSYNLLFHAPDLDRANFQPRFDGFPWRPANETDDAVEAWRRGRTGYPVVDAGMRQLWATGTMHNRVRMVVASFLVKHLLVDWRVGEAWFWDTLCDADPANNPASWQWVAGSGADAAPYFRIFNPVTQGRKFDPDGTYVKRWVPEIAGLPAGVVHAPWIAPEETLRGSGIVLGHTYPRPVVDHDAARRRALEAFGSLKSEAA